MRADQAVPQNIDEYIAGFPKDVQEILQGIRMTIREAVPEAKETISYRMPAFTLRGRNLVYFGAHKQHIGFYPAPRAIEEFGDDLRAYGAGRGTLRFPLNKPIPYHLIGRIVRFKASELLEKAAGRERKR